MTTLSTSGSISAGAGDLLAAGRLALARGAWAEGRDLLTRALDAEESPQVLEGLAVATFQTRDVSRAVELRQRAYRLYLEQGDRRGAARVATGLALDCEHYLGETAVANGWKERAASLLADLEPCAEHAWLALWRAHHAILFHDQLERGRALLSEALAIAHGRGWSELELLARGLLGFSLVAEGKLADGMRYLDEAATAAVAGELRDPEVRGSACCYVMTACEQVLDLERAAQWHRRVRDQYQLEEQHVGLTFCRKHYVQILLWSGDWAEAEAEIERLRAETPAEMRLLAGDANVLLGELRRRQGRLDEARAVFDREAEHPRSLLGRAALELDLGRAGAALRLAERYLRQLAEPVRTEHVPGLWVEARAAAAEGDAERAGRSASALDGLAEALGTELMKAFAAAAWGHAERARGDLEASRRRFEEAIAFFARSRAPFEAAHTRLDLSAVLRELGDGPGAEIECRAAAAAFERLGAGAGAERAGRELAAATAVGGAEQAARAGGAIEAPEDCCIEPGAGATAGARVGAAEGGAGAGRLPLSERELEVLRLLAEGLSNAEMAERLCLSAHTVKRHVANILAKLDLPTRAAAAALAARVGLV